MLNGIRRFGFRLLYNECAFTYDTVSRAVSLGRWQSWQRSVIPMLPPPGNGLILELAHGTGDLQIDLANAGYRAIALDRSRNMGQLAQQKLARGELRAALLRGDAGRLPVKSDSVAALVCTFPTSFILDSRTLSEVRRVLKRDAPAIIVLSGLLTCGGLRARLIRSLYLLAGQTYSESTHAEIHSMFKVPGLSTKARVMPMGGSLVQMVLLTKTAARSIDERDHSLVKAQEKWYIES